MKHWASLVLLAVLSTTAEMKPLATKQVKDAATKCPDGMALNAKTGRCIIKMRCRSFCPEGQAFDPRDEQGCSCVDKALFAQLIEVEEEKQMEKRYEENDRLRHRESRANGVNRSMYDCNDGHSCPPGYFKDESLIGHCICMQLKNKHFLQ